MRSEPLRGSELSWRDWLARYAAFATRGEMGAHHIEAWEWFDSLSPGTSPDALVEAWSRGHGKSTTLELGIARVCVKATRRFALYVSCDQNAANRHVQACAAMMERVGVDRLLNKYGHSRGWRADMLRAANGFNVLGFGLDAGARGVKLDDIRPDLIILDDIDELHDTGDGVAKKIETITQTILPTGGDDCAVCFFQNPIHANSVMSRLLKGELDMLRRRNAARPIPAISGLAYEEIDDQDADRKVYAITQGVATWPGKPISACEDEINRLGLISFLRECQHDVGVGGRFFDTWQSAKGDEETIHEVWSFPIPKHWRFEGGFDWGRSNPFCFLLNAFDEQGGVITIDEAYAANMSNDEQATEILRVLERNGLKKEQVTIYADPSIFPPASAKERVGRYTAEDFWDKGLRFVRANNSRINGWARVKEYIDARQHGVPGLRVFKDKCRNLIRTLPLMIRDPHRPEDLDTTLEDHAVDTWRYSIERPRMSAADPAKPIERKPKPYRDPFLDMAEDKRTL